MTESAIPSQSDPLSASLTEEQDGFQTMSPKQLYFSFEGRINRQTYWLKYFLPVVGIFFCAGLISGWLGSNTTAGQSVMIIVQLASIWPGIAVAAKRWHDRGKSGWWSIICVIPIIGTIWMLIELGFLAGSDTENQYGLPPR